MTHQHTLKGADSRGNLDSIPFVMTEEEELQIKLYVADLLAALTGLPTIQQRGRELQAEVKQAVSKLVVTDLSHGTTAEWFERVPEINPKGD